MIEKIISEALGCDLDAIKDESRFVEDLGADSLNIVEIVMGIEDEFDLDIPDEDAEIIFTVKELKEYVEANA